MTFSTFAIFHETFLEHSMNMQISELMIKYQTFSYVCEGKTCPLSILNKCEIF